MQNNDQNLSQNTSESNKELNATPMVLTDAAGEHVPAPYDPALLAFIHEGTEIRNPYVSPDGRTLVSPVSVYGFVEYHTGGGCMALMRPHSERRVFYLTQDGIYIADPQDWRECVISVSDAEGNDLAYCDLAAVPSSSEPGHQNAIENPFCPEELKHESPEALKDRYRVWAQENLANDDLEFDEQASVSLCEGGAFVQARIWVAFNSLPLPPDDADDDEGV
jgi:hypothetical protein